ncbi:BTAD domain-containing putative transcriptional regulator [Nocardiopsis terrae]
MRVEMLGSFGVRDGHGRPLTVPGGRVVSLLARLALSPGQVVPTGALLEDLWDGAPPDGGHSTVQRLASRARSHLRDRGVTDLGPVATPGGYMLDVPSEEVDSHVFEQLAVRGGALLRGHDPHGAAETLRRALELWRDEPLVDVRGRFAETERQRLAELRLSATEDLIESGIRAGDKGDPVPELRAVCDAHPLRERCHGLLVLALRRSGRDGEALAAYERLRTTLAEELGTEPAPWLRELHTNILRAVAPPRHGWSNPYLTRFFGRERELESIGALLGRTRLVTLLGPGGVGKTRTAAEFASRDEGGDRPVHFVELAVVRDRNGIVDALADAVGVGGGSLAVGQDPGPSRLSQVLSAFSGSRALLVLDDCEHLVDDVAAVLVGLLAHCPQLRVLATSREPLAVNGEALISLDPLGLPEGDPRQSTAVAMFVELASLTSPGLVFDDEATGTVAQICRRIDGLPLAIELAAARTRSMSLREISRHLEERFTLLSTTRRPVANRHRTLRAVLEWSWNLLTDEERTVACRTSVLPGGVTEPAAAAVCSGSGVTPEDVPFLLAGLSDRSLLRTAGSPRGRARYRFLETTQAYARERLLESGESENAWAGAVAHHTELVEDAAGELLGRGQAEALRSLDEEYDNVMAVLRYVSERGDTAVAARLTRALSWYWVLRGRYEDASRWAGEVTGREEELPGDTRDVLRALRAMLPVREDAGRDDTGQTDAVRLATDAEALSAYPPLAVIGLRCALAAGDWELVGSVIDATREHPHPWVRAAGLSYRALWAEARGDSERAEAATEEAAGAFRAVGDRWMTAQLLRALAEYQSLRGEGEHAVRGLREALELTGSVGESASLAVTVLISLGTEQMRAGLLDDADTTFARVLSAEPAPIVEHRIQCLARMSDLALARELTGQARRLTSEARALLDDARQDTAYLRAEVLQREAAVALAEDDPERAREAASAALELAVELGMNSYSASVLELVAGLESAGGDARAAARALGTAAHTRGRRDQGSPRVRALLSHLEKELGREELEALMAEAEREPHGFR